MAIFIALLVMWTNARANPTVPDLNQLIRAPQIIEFQQKPHAVFDYGGLEFLFVVSQTPNPFPQCDAVQKINDELMVVGSDPFGYVFFVVKYPVAFKTDHNPIWNKLIEKSCEGCE